MKEQFRINNFDIIRLFAALEVAARHAFTHLEIKQNIAFELLRPFPGVPIFFFISGFLISKSYENNSIIKEYTRNRILRIYPALIVCTFISVISVYFTGYFSNREIRLCDFLLWIIGEISGILRFNPAFMAEFGTGKLNGVLWTITVELQFYIILPIIYCIFDLGKSKKSNQTILLIVFFMSFQIAYHILIRDNNSYFLFKLFGISFLPWVYMFLVGLLFQRNFEILYRLLSGKGLYILTLYLTISYLAIEYFGWNTGNRINPILYFFLATTLFSLAYSKPKLSKYILKGNDISYGVYIYHMPIINIFIYYGYLTNIFYALNVILITIGISTLSWIVIEKSCMKKKVRPLILAD